MTTFPSLAFLDDGTPTIAAFSSSHDVSDHHTPGLSRPAKDTDKVLLRRVISTSGGGRVPARRDRCPMRRICPRRTRISFSGGRWGWSAPVRPSRRRGPTAASTAASTSTTRPTSAGPRSRWSSRSKRARHGLAGARPARSAGPRRRAHTIFFRTDQINPSYQKCMIAITMIRAVATRLLPSLISAQKP